MHGSLMQTPLEPWFDNLPPELVAIQIRAGMGSGDRNPQTIAMLAIKSLPWMNKKDQAPELVASREDLLEAVRQIVADNAGDEAGVMIRLVPWLENGKTIRGWTRTAQAVTTTDSWTKMPAAESAERLWARGMAEAQASQARAMVAFLDKTTDTMGVIGEALRNSQEAQTALLHEIADLQRQWLEAMAEDLGQAAEDLAEMPAATDSDFRREALDLLRSLFTGEDHEDDAPELEPEPDP